MKYLRELFSRFPGILFQVIRSLFKSETPLWFKLIVSIALLYFFFPLDLIPDTIPVVGWLDDLIVILSACGLWPKAAPNPYI